MSRRPAGLALFTLVLGATAIARVSASVPVVSPSGLAAVEGNTESQIPISLFPADVTSLRYQQVYDASEFTSFGMPISISSLAFRPDGPAGNSFAATSLTAFTINLSTTPTAVDNLSSTFAVNLGADFTTVFTGSATVSSAFTPAVGTPKDFDITFDFTTPFVYNPASGNLLLELIVESAHTTTPVDAHNDDQIIPKDATSSAYALLSTAPSADFVNSFGLVTQFGANPVPEAGATAAAWAAAAGVVAVVIRARRKRASDPV